MNTQVKDYYHKEHIFFSGDNYFASLLRDIERSENSIDIEIYIFALDALGKRMLDALISAVRRGVVVRILVDSAGSPQWGSNSKLIRALEDAGGRTRVFHSFPWQFWQWSRSFMRMPLILKAIYSTLKINSRNHRKVFIIDRKIAYIGSHNIAQCHLETCGGDGWRDTGVRLENINLDNLILAFESAWDNLTIPERLKQIFHHVHTNPIFRLNYSRHRRRVLYKNLLQRIKKCKQKIWITNAYFVPDNFLMKKLLDAASRGVDVRILLPRKSDVAFMPWTSEAFYEKLLKAGVRIFEYLPAVLHAKTLILDSWMLIGSSNLNHRSLLHDLEVDVNIRLPETKDALEEQFLHDLKKSKEVTLKSRRNLLLYQRIIAGFALYMKYWI